MRQDGRVPPGLEMHGRCLVVRPLVLDALALEVELNPFSVDLRQLLCLQLESWDSVALGEMLSNRVEYDSSSTWAAKLWRRSRDKSLREHQHTAVLDAWMH